MDLELQTSMNHELMIPQICANSRKQPLAILPSRPLPDERRQYFRKPCCHQNSGACHSTAAGHVFGIHLSEQEDRGYRINVLCFFWLLWLPPPREQHQNVLGHHWSVCICHAVGLGRFLVVGAHDPRRTVCLFGLLALRTRTGSTLLHSTSHFQDPVFDFPDKFSPLGATEVDVG